MEQKILDTDQKEIESKNSSILYNWGLELELVSKK